MRFAHIFTIVSAAIAAIAVPVATPEKRDDASILDQATDVLHQLNKDLADQIGALNKASGDAKIFQPFGYNVAVSLSTAFGKAINGIQGLPDLPSNENKPEYVVDHFAPLVDNTSEITFSYIKQLIYESRQLFNSPQYNYYQTQMDAGLHNLVLAIDAKFSGYACALAKAVGINTVPGQALAEVSTHTFAILFDAINVGQCS